MAQSFLRFDGWVTFTLNLGKDTFWLILTGRKWRHTKKKYGDVCFGWMTWRSCWRHSITHTYLLPQKIPNPCCHLVVSATTHVEIQNEATESKKKNSTMGRNSFERCYSQANQDVVLLQIIHSKWYDKEEIRWSGRTKVLLKGVPCVIFWKFSELMNRNSIQETLLSKRWHMKQTKWLSYSPDEFGTLTRAIPSTSKKKHFVLIIFSRRLL